MLYAFLHLKIFPKLTFTNIVLKIQQNLSSLTYRFSIYFVIYDSRKGDLLKDVRIWSKETQTFGSQKSLLQRTIKTLNNMLYKVGLLKSYCFSRLDYPVTFGQLC